MSISPTPSPRSRPDHRALWGLLRCQRGSALIATIIAATIAATLGTAIYSFVSTSSLTQIGSLNDTMAYYLAESGGHYGIKRLADPAVDLSNSTARDALTAQLAAQPYLVANAGQFRLEFPSPYYSTGGGFAQVKFNATGTPLDASVSRAISYVVKVPDPSGTPIPFDGTGPDLNPENWNVSGPGVLDTTDPGNPKVVLGGTGDSQISLDWTNPNSTMPNLLDVWNDSYGLLTYEAQVKIKLSTAQDVMAGLSFRLNTGGNTTITDDSFYGLSYLWCESNATGRDLPTFCGTQTSRTYVVLWKQAADGTRTIIGKQQASSVTSGLVSSNALVDWATLVVRLQEQFNPTTGLRENMISAFVGIPSTSPKGTIHWDYTKYPAVQWNTSFSGIDCSGGQKSFISDATFTSADFDTLPRDEVGLHALGRAQAEVADLALRFNFDGGVASTCVTGAPGTIKLTASTFTKAENAGTVTITASRSGGAGGAVSVSYATTGGGTATAGSDYTATSGTLTWAEGDTADKSFTVTILDDAGFESSETVNLAITSPTGGATLGTPNTAVLTITDDDGVMPCNAWPNTALKSGTTSLSNTFVTSACADRLLVCAITSELGAANSSFTVTGNYGGQNFTTLRSTTGLNTRQHVWLGYVKEAGIAARGNDTVTTSITAGSTPTGSNLYCASYKGVDQAYPIAGSRANYNSGSSTISFGGSVAVTNGGYIFYVSAANGASSTPPSGYVEHWDQALNSYSQAGGSKKITATGTESKSWSLNSGDRWGLAVGSLNPALGGGSSGTIEFSLPSYTVAENGGTATITASRTGGAVGAVGVSFATAGGATATPGSDYTGTSGTLSWADGDVVDKTFTVPILDDVTAEGDETVNLALTSATGGATLGAQDTAVLSIVDNEAPVPGSIAFSSATYSRSENGGTVTITASRSGGVNGAVGVSYATTAGGTATSGSDYTPKSGTLSWADGDSANKTFTITILDDAVAEANETVNLALTSATGGATLGGQNTAVLTIVDNEPAAPGTIKLSAGTYSVAEGGGVVTITATRSGGASGTVGVSYATTAGGTATAASDYTATSGTLTWADGDGTNKTFTITILDDTAVEANETVNLGLTTPTGGATLGSPNTAVLTIIDNDSIKVCNAWQLTDLNSGTNSLSGSFVTSTACTNRLLVCTVSSELNSENTSYSVTGTYGGQTFSTLVSTNTKNSRQHVWLGYVKEAGIAGRSNDTVSLSVSAGSSPSGSNLYCASYEGVDQTTPIAGSRSNYNSGSSSVSFGGTVNVTNGGYIFYSQAANGASSGVPSGYAEHWDQGLSGYSQAGGSKAITATGTENPSSWSLGSSERWGLAVGSLNPVAGGVSVGTIAFSAPTYTGAENGGTATITAIRTGGSGAVTVDYATSNGTATAGSDYTSTSGTLSWGSGDTAGKTFTIPILDDTDQEGDETVNLALANVTGGAVLGVPITAVLTITDNDTVPGTIALSAATYSRGEMGGTATITATRTGGSDGVVGVSYATSNGTATQGSDYTSASGTLSWADGDPASKTFTVTILDDAAYEGNETVNLAITTPTGGATLGAPNTAVLTIVDSEVAARGTIALTAATYSVLEQDASTTVTITATRTGGANGAVGVSYNTSNGTASTGSDYNAASGTLSWADGVTGNKTFTITILGDTIGEANETLNLAITTPTGGATLGAPNTAVVTIYNDDAKTYYVQPDTATTLGVDGTANVASGQVTTAPFVLTTFDPAGNGGTGSSYRPTSGMANGTTTVLMKVYTSVYATTAVNISEIAASLAVRGNNSGDKFGVNLYDYNPAGAFGNETLVATGTTKTIATSGTTEQMTWTATDFTLNGTGQVGQDHRLLAKLTYRPNGTNYSPRIYYDTTGSLTESTLAVLETPGSGTVAGTIALSAATYSVGEAGPVVTITATRTGGFTGAVGVSYNTSNGTATSGSDYTATSGTLSWANGDSANKTFTIPIADDTAVEGDETVNLSLTTPTGGATLGTPSTAALTIIDNDGIKGTISLSTASYSVAETGGSVTITATRSGGSYGAVGVDYGTSSGTATAGSDYTETSGTLSWDDGDPADKTFTIPILDDAVYESDETVNVALTNTTGGAALGAPATAVVTIPANDAVPGTITLSAATYSVNESGGTATITATRSGGADGAVGVSYTTSNGTATSGSDYTAASGTLTWAHGDTANKTFTVAITNDTSVEGDQTVNLSITTPTGGATLGSPSTAVLTIVDDDVASISVLNAWPGSPQLTGTSGNMSGTFTIGAGTGRLLVVAVSCYDSGGATGQTFSATYGGKTLTQAKIENSNRRQTWIGYLKEADIASRSSDTLAVTISGTHTGVSAFVASYQNVNQTTPIAASGGGYIDNTDNVTINTSTLSAGAGEYAIYNWSGSSGITRTSDNESYTEHADTTSGGVNVGVASKAFSSAANTNPTVDWSAAIRASVSFIVLNK